jgi:hypothetical protein
MHSDLHVTPRSWAGLRLDRPLVMGILNLTSDSFSGAGPADPIAAGRALRDAGADIVDIGAESTRPGAGPVPAAEQIARVTAVIAALCRDGPVSIDTRSAAVMAAALQAGATIINDVSGLTHDPAAAALVAAAGCPVIIMHMRGSPATMSCQAHYRDLVRDVLDELLACRDRAVAAGVKPEMISLDPGRMSGFSRPCPALPPWATRWSSASPAKNSSARQPARPIRRTGSAGLSPPPFMPPPTARIYCACTTSRRPRRRCACGRR